MSFAFSFSGDDIQDDHDIGGSSQPACQPTGDASAAPDAASSSAPPEPPRSTNGSNSAFPIEGRPQLPALAHDLDAMLDAMPSKVAYDVLNVALDDGGTIGLPRRELWDVRLQLMAEDDEGGSGLEGLGRHDVKTGVYEGGFKSWESSVDLVKVLSSRGYGSGDGGRAPRVIELGCGTALPSMALFQSILSKRLAATDASAWDPLVMTLADYNPSVLQLVTVPNFIITWALLCKDTEPALKEAFDMEGELELTPEVKAAFRRALSSANVSLSWLSGGWSPEFIELLYTTSTAESEAQQRPRDTLILGAETIYSPFALRVFYETVMEILRRESGEGRQQPGCGAEALVGAKRLYFGVGGSLDDFVAKAREGGATVEQLREETEGVRRGVVSCRLVAGS